MLLTKLNVTGNRINVNIFVDALGQSLSVKCTDEEYAALQQSTPQIPDGYSWVRSEGGCVEWDSADGLMHDGEYGEADGFFIVKLSNSMRCYVKKGSIVENNLDDSVADEILSTHGMNVEPYGY
jgi:hypothetical protein